MHALIVPELTDWPEWSNDERQQFAPLEQRWTDRAKFPITVQRLLEGWARFTVSVESGVADGSVIEDYWNDLDTRLLLQEALDSLPSDTSHRLEEAIRPLDSRFRDATLEEQPARWRGGWWASRIPKNPTPAFARELHH